MSKAESIDFGSSFALGGFNQLQGDALNKAFADYRTGIMNSVTAKCGDLTNQSLDVQQGFTAEAHHVGSFNIEAAAKGQLNHNATLDVGQVTHSLVEMCSRRKLKATKFRQRKLSVAVITPYLAQCRALREAINKLDIREYLAVKVDTVDAFQGRQADIVFFSFVRTTGSAVHRAVFVVGVYASDVLISQ